MDLKLFKAFTPCVNRAAKPITAKQFDHLAGSEGVPDPTGQQWTTGGFTPFDTGEFVIDVNGAGLLAMILVNERILPAAVIKEKMIDRIADIERRDQRKANKKDYAQVKDEVIASLLPKAFIKRTYIPILFLKGRGDEQYILVFTSSAKKADDVMASLNVLFTVWTDAGKHWEPAHLYNITNNDITSKLNSVARGESLDGESDGESTEQYMQLGTSLVVKGSNKQKVTIAQKDIGSSDVQNLLTAGNYDVTKIGLEFYDGDVDSAAIYSLTDKLVFSGLKLTGVTKNKADDEADAAAELLHNVWVIARTAADMLSTLVEGLGGLREKGKQPETIESADDGQVGSGDASEKNSSGISSAAQSIIDDPLHQTDPASEFGVDSDSTFSGIDDDDEL